MNESILTSVKKLLGIDESDTSFDQDIIMHINAMFMILTQEWFNTKSFRIEDSTATWSDFLDDQEEYDAIKTWMYLRVRTIFDPPSNSSVLQAMNEQIKELEWRMYIWKDNERIDAEAN